MKTRTVTSTADAARRPDDEGFTLIEIVIAIVLVGILSAVAVVGIGSLTDKGSSAACTASADAAKAATVVHFASTGEYPADLSAMTDSKFPSLTLPEGVTVDKGGLTTTGASWTLSMTVDAGRPPTFSCS
jgi:prepilin-type N-terminal cleavage/methylation domain-containing protein